eukprot:scaffold825_cov249-Pinguiococcus_pyrenoidosus.AAC.68
MSIAASSLPPLTWLCDSSASMTIIIGACAAMLGPGLYLTLRRSSCRSLSTWLLNWNSEFERAWLAMAWCLFLPIGLAGSRLTLCEDDKVRSIHDLRNCGTHVDAVDGQLAADPSVVCGSAGHALSILLYGLVWVSAAGAFLLATYRLTTASYVFEDDRDHERVVQQMEIEYALGEFLTGADTTRREKQKGSCHRRLIKIVGRSERCIRSHEVISLGELSPEWPLVSICDASAEGASRGGVLAAEPGGDAASRGVLVHLHVLPHVLLAGGALSPGLVKSDLPRQRADYGHQCHVRVYDGPASPKPTSGCADSVDHPDLSQQLRAGALDRKCALLCCHRKGSFLLVAENEQRSVMTVKELTRGVGLCVCRRTGPAKTRSSASSPSTRVLRRGYFVPKG